MEIYNKITKSMIREGIKQGLVQFVVDRNLDAGTVCLIDESWFYFGGELAESHDPEQYLAIHPMEDIISEVFDALESMIDDEYMHDEYVYYWGYLSDHLQGYENFRFEENKPERLWLLKAKPYGYKDLWKLLAYVDDLTGRIMIVDHEACQDPEITKMLQTKVKEVEGNQILVKINNLGIAPNTSGSVSLTLKTPIGTISADAETERLTGNDAMFIGIAYSDDPGMYADLTAVKVCDQELKIMNWTDVWSEDYTQDTIICEEEIADLIQSIREN